MSMVSTAEHELAREFTRPKRILLVEDDRNLCDLIVQHSSDLNCEWTVVHSADCKICPLVKDNNFDLVLLDLRLPGLPGDELFKMLTIDSTHTQNVVIFSAFPDSPEAQAAINNGATVFVLKPTAVTKAWIERMLLIFGVKRRHTQAVARRPNV